MQTNSEQFNRESMPDGDEEQVRFTVLMPTSLRDRIVAAANRYRRSGSAQARVYIESALELEARNTMQQP